MSRPAERRVLARMMYPSAIYLVGLIATARGRRASTQRNNETGDTHVLDTSYR